MNKDLKKRGKNRELDGFTLIELLITISIIAIISAVAFVALDPLTRFQDSRDSSRWTDISAIISAVKIDQVDNGGEYLQQIKDLDIDANYIIVDATTTSNCIKSCDVVIPSDGHCANLKPLVDEEYLGTMPISPNGVADWISPYTGYYIVRNTGGSVTVGSCESENSSDIFITQ